MNWDELRQDFTNRGFREMPTRRFMKEWVIGLLATVALYLTAFLFGVKIFNTVEIVMVKALSLILGGAFFEIAVSLTVSMGILFQVRYKK